MTKVVPRRQYVETVKPGAGDSTAMVTSRTPFRVSLFGGGTDYPTWYRQHGGAVMGTTINKYCYISYRNLPPFFEHRHRIVYSRIELPQTIDQIEHPAVRNILQDYKISDGVEIQHHGDLPARSGLGSSSAFTVGLLNALRAHDGRISSPEWLAKEAIRMEQQVIQEAVGSQDQIWAAYGGTNFISFHTDGSFSVTPVVMSQARRDELQSHMMLFFTRFSRVAQTVAALKIKNLLARQQQLQTIRRMAEEARNILQSPDRPISELGMLLREAWCVKKELADGVTTPAIDEIQQAAIRAGALGAKLLGAGGGGFMLILAEPQNHAAIREALKGLIEVSFRIGSAGSRIVIYETNGI
jgi:D-glycero-alpha-D-manno-heptose-7-phosphate kinase